MWGFTMARSIWQGWQHHDARLRCPTAAHDPNPTLQGRKTCRGPGRSTRWSAVVRLDRVSGQ